MKMKVRQSKCNIFPCNGRCFRRGQGWVILFMIMVIMAWCCWQWWWLAFWPRQWEQSWSFFIVAVYGIMVMVVILAPMMARWWWWWCRDVAGDGAIMVMLWWWWWRWWWQWRQCCWMVILLMVSMAAWEKRWHCNATTGFSMKWHLRNECRNSILMTCHYPHLGSASDWSCHHASGFQVTGIIKRFLWVWNFQFQDIFGLKNFGNIFWGSLI